MSRKPWKIGRATKKGGSRYPLKDRRLGEVVGYLIRDSYQTSTGGSSVARWIGAGLDGKEVAKS